MSEALELSRQRVSIGQFCLQPALELQGTPFAVAGRLRCRETGTGGHGSRELLAGKLSCSEL